MDTYNNQTIMTDYHTDFYTYQPMIDLYEQYAQEIVTRYRNSSAIFAWELANEPRANGYPTISRPNATDAELTQWFADRSAYIKSIDPQHMVCIGRVFSQEKVIVGYFAYAIQGRRVLQQHVQHHGLYLQRRVRHGL